MTFSSRAVAVLSCLIAIGCTFPDYETVTFDEYTESGETVVTDPLTGLEWQKTYATEKTWQEAVDYCENLTYAGHDDWRLPEIGELESLVNEDKQNPASDFPDMPALWFWSSSQVADSADDAWYIYFEYGYSYGGAKTFARSARCVREET